MSRARNTSIFPVLNNYIKFSESSDRFSHLKIQNPDERFDWSIDRVAFWQTRDVVGCEDVCGGRLCKLGLQGE